MFEAKEEDEAVSKTKCLIYFNYLSFFFIHVIVLQLIIQRDLPL